MSKKFLKPLKYTMITVLVLFVLLTAGVALRLFYIPQLKPWHTFAPVELTAAEMKNATWEEYIDRENKIFDDVYHEVVLKTPEDDRASLNRYFSGSRIYPPSLKEDWNRSRLLIPENPKGSVVLLHGLTDCPYSVRHIAQLYYQKGFATLMLRMPGHGTVPGGLTKVTWQDWVAATRLAVREARKLSPEGTPLHIVGFSQGGALTVKYALDALEDDSLIRPDRLVLLSPMIGITRLSKVAEIMAIPSFLPGFEKAAWLGIVPEFNPFKFNSFPVNAVKQARLLITDMRQQIARLYENGQIKEFPPVVTFQSIVDYTVSTPALVNDLYSYLPDNGSELVIFDINRDTAFMPLVRPFFIDMIAKTLPDLPQRYKMTVIGNSAAGNFSTVEWSALPGDEDFTVRELGLIYPPNVFSLSHVSLPFPDDDPLYGSSPDPKTKDAFGLNLGLASNTKGERGILDINTNMLFRISSNPLFPYLTQRMADVISGPPVPRASPGKHYNINTKAKITEEEYDEMVKELDYNEGQF
ncbi:MAG: alpha/beta hydrolase [Azonexus sp.]|jgi:alpha-beta hydrolase superfamily lysophospholipase|uniref:alpha/beta hydrolase n=1 Tax=Azonexus sp. TaxID=1872668 RepID=UPI00282A0D37|nr:alpha/beta hydrolase [Azonexus sp.]MDR0776914.1 alpha/beta hydrolase [Azonexus sp.]